MTSYRLQRAIGTGSYSFASGVLPSTARAATDTAAHNGNTYKYRVVAYRSASDSGFSNTLTIPLDDIGAVARTTAGKIFSDDFNRADGDLGPAWATLAGNSFRIVGNKAIPPSPASGSDFMRLKDSLMTPSSTSCVQADLTSTSGGGAPMLGTRVTSSGSWTGWLLFMDPAGGNVLRFYSVVNLSGAEVFSTAGGLYTLNAAQDTKLCTTDGSQKAWLNGQLIMNISSVALDGVAGTVGMRTGGSSPGDATFDNFVATRSNTVTITGLPVGYKLRVGGLTSAAASSGAVTLDLQGVKFPSARIDILDASGTLVKQFTPSDGVWGGDEFSFTAAP